MLPDQRHLEIGGTSGPEIGAGKWAQWLEMGWNANGSDPGKGANDSKIHWILGQVVINIEEQTHQARRGLVQDKEKML